MDNGRKVGGMECPFLLFFFIIFFSSLLFFFRELNSLSELGNQVRTIYIYISIYIYTCILYMYIGST